MPEAWKRVAAFCASCAASSVRFSSRSYVTGGMTWSADYNIVAPETGDVLDLLGWVTLDNQSGKQFDHARIKLMAGDVNRVRAPGTQIVTAAIGGFGGGGGPPQVTERSFEDYHLY